MNHGSSSCSNSVQISILHPWDPGNIQTPLEQSHTFLFFFLFQKWFKTSMNFLPPKSASNPSPPTLRTSCGTVSVQMSGWTAVSCPPWRSCVITGWQKNGQEGLPPQPAHPGNHLLRNASCGGRLYPSQPPMEQSVGRLRLLLTCCLVWNRTLCFSTVTVDFWALMLFELLFYYY